MAEEVSDSVTSQDMRSDFHYDPFCDPCAKKSVNSEATGFCTTCVEFLCKSCDDVHRYLAIASNHTIVKGSEMPRSQADKPPRLNTCEIHEKELNDKFCNEHRLMVCSVCITKSHRSCKISEMQDAFRLVGATEIEELQHFVTDFKTNMVLTKSDIESRLFELEEQKHEIVQKYRNLKDQAISKINQEFQDAILNVDFVFEKLFNEVHSQTYKLDELIVNVSIVLDNINNSKATTIDENLFLELQDIVDCVNKISSDYNKLTDSLRKHTVSFTTCPACKIFITSSFKFGSVKLNTSNDIVNRAIEKVTFPVSPVSTIQTRGQIQLLNARKISTVSVKLEDDADTCWIRGMAVTRHGRRLMVDFNNKRLKMFTKGMIFLSAISLSDWLWDVAVINDNTAVVSMGSKTLVFLDISTVQISIHSKLALPFIVKDLSAYKGKVIVVNQFATPVSVRLIDTTGKLYWTTSLEQKDQLNTKSAANVFDTSLSVIVSDRTRHTVYMLNAETGAILRSLTLEGKEPHDVTTDSKGNAYVTCMNSNEIVVLSRYLVDSKVLISGTGLGLLSSVLRREYSCLSGEKPYALAYDETCHEIIVSYTNNNLVDCFHLCAAIT